MSCGRYQVWLSALLDGELDAREREELRGHLEQCRSCREEAEANHRLSLCLHSWTPPEAPENLEVSFRQRLREEAACGPASARRRPLRWLPLGAPASLALAASGVAATLLVAGWTLRQPPAPQPLPAATPVVDFPQVERAALALRGMVDDELQARLRRASEVVYEGLKQPPEPPPASGQLPAIEEAPGEAPAVPASDEVPEVRG